MKHIYCKVQKVENCYRCVAYLSNFQPYVQWDKGILAHANSFRRGTGRGMQTLEAGSKVSKDISGHVTAFVCILYY